MADVLPIEALPSGFWYPEEFVRVVELGLVNQEPWRILSSREAGHRMDGMRSRYPDRLLVPFAARQDNDDVACWDARFAPARAVLIHDFAESGWEQHREYDNFYDWLQQAVQDLIDFG